MVTGTVGIASFTVASTELLARKEKETHEDYSRERIAAVFMR